MAEVIRLHLKVGDRKVPFHLAQGLTCRQAAAIMAHCSDWAPWWAYDYALVEETVTDWLLLDGDGLVKDLNDKVVWLGWKLPHNN